MSYVALPWCVTDDYGRQTTTDANEQNITGPYTMCRRASNETIPIVSDDNIQRRYVSPSKTLTVRDVGCVEKIAAILTVARALMSRTKSDTSLPVYDSTSHSRFISHSNKLITYVK